MNICYFHLMKNLFVTVKKSLCFPTARQKVAQNKINTMPPLLLLDTQLSSLVATYTHWAENTES